MDKLIQNYIPKKKQDAVESVVKDGKRYRVVLKGNNFYIDNQGQRHSEFIAGSTAELSLMAKSIKYVQVSDTLFDEDMRKLNEEYHRLKEWWEQIEKEDQENERKRREQIARSAAKKHW